MVHTLIINESQWYPAVSIIGINSIIICQKYTNAKIKMKIINLSEHRKLFYWEFNEKIVHFNAFPAE